MQKTKSLTFIDQTHPWIYLTALPEALVMEPRRVSIQLLEAAFLGDDRSCGPQGSYDQAGSLGAILITQFFLHPVAAFGFTGSS